MEWDTPIDRMVRERAMQAREREAARALKFQALKTPEAEPEVEPGPETIIITPQQD